MDENEQAEVEKQIRVALKLRGYGYDEFYDEMREQGLGVGLYADDSTYALEVEDAGEQTAIARMSRYSVRALDRAGRQIRAQLEVEQDL